MASLPQYSSIKEALTEETIIEVPETDSPAVTVSTFGRVNPVLTNHERWFFCAPASKSPLKFPRKFPN